LFSRELAERSPYYEALKERNLEVLFCFQPYDEMVLLQMRQYDRRNLTSVEKEMRQMKDDLNFDTLRKLNLLFCTNLHWKLNNR